MTKKQMTFGGLLWSTSSKTIAMPHPLGGGTERTVTYHVSSSIGSVCFIIYHDPDTSKYHAIMADNYSGRVNRWVQNDGGEIAVINDYGGFTTIDEAGAAITSVMFEIGNMPPPDTTEQHGSGHNILAHISGLWQVASVYDNSIDKWETSLSQMSIEFTPIEDWNGLPPVRDPLPFIAANMREWERRRQRE